jgi:hypothetical protein
LRIGIAEKSRLEFTSCNLDAEGMLDSADGIWRFTEINLRLVVTVLKEGNHDRAIHVLEKSEKSCLIARSLQCKIVFFPAAKVEEELSVPASVRNETASEPPFSGPDLPRPPSAGRSTGKHFGGERNRGDP